MSLEKYGIVDINVNTKITNKIASKILATIIEFLLFNKHQIPCLFECFPNFFSNNESTTANAVKSYRLGERNKRAFRAYETYNTLINVSNNITLIK